MKIPWGARGKGFEHDIIERAKVYEAKKYLVLRKVDPPSRIIRGRVLFLANPFLDFVGSFTERGGRAIFLEAKETHEDKLGIGAKTNGITDKQLHSLRVWHHSGAIAGTLWKCPAGVYLIPIALLDAIAQRTQFKHIKVGDVPAQCKCDRDGQLNIISAVRRLWQE